MSYSIQETISTGALSTLSISIDYIARSDIHVFVDDVEVFATGATTWAWVGSTNVIKVTPTLSYGKVLKVVRKTNKDEALHLFDAGAIFRGATLDENFLQVLYLAQEYSEQNISGGGGGVAGVQTFNGRTGDVTPLTNDYSISQITGAGTAATKDVGTGAAQLILGNDTRLTNSREWLADTVSQAVAEAGTSSTRYAWTPLRINQAIQSLAPAGGGGTAGVTSFNGRTGNVVPKAGDYFSIDIGGLGTAAEKDVGIGAGNVILGNDSRLTNSREWSAATVTQVLAESGTSTARLAWTPERIKQAILALAPTGGSGSSFFVTDTIHSFMKEPIANKAAYIRENMWGVYDDVTAVQYIQVDLDNGNLTGLGTASFVDVSIRSDARDKSNINKIDNALLKLSTLSGNTYDLSTAAGTVSSAGLLAQEVIGVLPEVIGVSKNHIGEDRYTVAYQGVIALLVEAVNELSAKVKRLEDAYA